MKTIRIKRIYDAPESDDGARILVDRLWPRGIKKEDADLTGWWKDIAPSNELRKWFGHQPERFQEFAGKYTEELDCSQEAAQCRDTVRQMLRTSGVTLLYAAKSPEMNNAVVLKKWLGNMDGCILSPQSIL